MQFAGGALATSNDVTEARNVREFWNKRMAYRIAQQICLTLRYAAIWSSALSGFTILEQSCSTIA